VAVDESPASRRAAAFVDAFFKGDEDSIVAVNVARVPTEWLPPAPYGGVYAWPAGRPYDESELDEALAREEARAEAVATQVAPHDAHIDVVFGDPVEAILNAAEDQNADLIVVGSNDRGFLQRLFGTSVSEKVTKEATRPVLVVP
jgi:nucleotide-binding universal stress UspA family protein